LARRRERILQLLANYEVQQFETTAAPHSARDLARSAAATRDLVIACGGDGTVHGVLQGVANTPACLGVLPLGTANALARNLGLPLDPVAALQTLLTFTPRDIPLGRAETAEGERWFTVMAGAGPDGRLIHEMKLATKARVGRAAYYAEAARLFATRTFPPFRVDYRPVGSSQWLALHAAAMMASRIPNFGGLFGALTPDSRLHHPHLLVQLLAAPARLSFPAWLAFARAGLHRHNPWLTTLEIEELRCTPVSPAQDTYAQVDGEAFGPIPLSLSIQPNGLRLLMP
jgi:diacylglycerol kinase family enzyme